MSPPGGESPITGDPADGHAETQGLPGLAVAGSVGAGAGAEAANAAEAADPAEAAEAAGPGTRLTRKERKAAAGKPRKGKRTWLDRVLLAGVVVVALTLVTVGSGYVYFQYRFSQVAKVTVKHLKKAPVGQPFNVLLIGSDTRSTESASDAAHFGSQASAGGQRSDVVKIVHIVPATGQASVLSIPRDTVVSVAGDTSQVGRYNRINATYNSGPDQLVQTIEANFGIPIEHVVQINFEGFRGAVDAVGGIDLNFPFPAQDTYTGLNITQQGCQHLNGGYALAVARSRHYQYEKDGYWQSDGTGDFGRIQRQNAFLKAVINQAEKQYNPLTLNAFIGSVVQGVTVDSTFTVNDLLSLAREFHTFSSQLLATATLPTYASYSSDFSSLGSVLYVQEPQAQQVITQFLGSAPESPFTPPPGPYGVVPSTTTSTTYPNTTTSTSSGGSSTPTSSSTTTTIETDFDPIPC